MENGGVEGNGMLLQIPRGKGQMSGRNRKSGYKKLKRHRSLPLAKTVLVGSDQGKTQLGKIVGSGGAQKLIKLK